MYSWTEYREIRKKYFGENREDSKKNYQRYKATCLKLCGYEDNSLATSIANVAALVRTEEGYYEYQWLPQEKGNNPMNYASATVTTAPTETQTQRKYLENRLSDIYLDKREPLDAAFGLTDDAAPNSPKELDERIKAGKFVIRGLDEDKKFDARFYHWTDLIQWRDPAKKADQEGFFKAREELKAERQKALDIIKIDEPKAGLDAVKAFEEWKPTGAAS